MQENIQENISKKDYWRNVCGDWEKSGETQQAYCQRLGIKVNTLSYWRAKFSGAKKKSNKSFVKVKTSPAVSFEQEKPIIIQLLSGIKIILPQKIDKGLLASLLELLGVANA